MFCQVCGNEVREDDKFCMQCGASVEKKEEKEEKKGMSCLGVGLLTGGILALPVLIVLGILLVLIVVIAIVIAITFMTPKKVDTTVNTVIEESFEEEEDLYEYEEEEYQYESTNPTEDVDYVLPQSAYSYITESDLYGLTKEECRIARNEIYARHGRMFNDEELQAYFNSKSWYTPTIPANSFQESMLNEYEKVNKDVILEYERAQGYE